MTLLLLMVFAISSAPAAVTVDFDIQPRALHMGEATMGSLTVRGVDNPPSPSFPPIQGFQVNMAGTERSFSMGTGGTDNAVTFRYQFLPLQTGTFTIGPFNYQINGQSFNLPGIQIEVVPPESAAGSGEQPASWSELLFAKLTSDRTNVVNQQVFDLTIAIYSRGLNLGRDISLMNMPDSGFSLKPFQELGNAREVVNNQVYDVRRFRCKAQALTAGTFTLEPVLRMSLLVQREQKKRRGIFDDPFFDHPFFSDPFFGNAQAQPVDVKPEALTLTVQPLPPPPGSNTFAGAVGQFNFEVEAKPTDLNVGDPITLTMQISGAGNIESITAPQVLASDDFKTYEARLSAKDINENAGAGRKVFEQVLIPKSDKTKELPALTFTYFDTEKQGYQTIVRGPFPLTLHASSNSTAKLMQTPAYLPEAKTLILGTDIVYLKPAPARWTRQTDHFWFKRTGFLAAQIVPAILLAFAVVSSKRRDELQRDTAKARRQRAPKSARLGLSKAEQSLAQSNRTGFYEAVWEALSSYFGDRLNLSPGEVSGEHVIGVFKTRGLKQEYLEDVRLLVETCERERFGGNASTVMTTEEKGRCEVILVRIARVLKACEGIRL